MSESIADLSHLPEHPQDPYIRIVGQSDRGARSVGDSCSWFLCTHSIFPNGLSEDCESVMTIFSEDGSKKIRELPAKRYYADRQSPDIERFDDQGAVIDVKYETELDPGELKPGRYQAVVELYSRDRKILWEDRLTFQAGAFPKLVAQIPLVSPSSRSMVRVGDVDGDGEIEFIHFVNANHVAVYKRSGECMWQYNDPDGACIYNSAPVRVYDVDGDGCDEVICPRGKMGSLSLCILDGATGKIKKSCEFPLLNSFPQPDPDRPDLREYLHKTGQAIRVSGRKTMYGAKLWIANFTGETASGDLLVQVGEQNCVSLVAMDRSLKELWRLRIDNGRAGHNSAISDVDGDGKDEVACGTMLIDHDGSILWEKPFEEFQAPWEDDHIDEADAGDINDDGEMEIIYSSRLAVKAATGETIWLDPTWHGQTVSTAPMIPDSKGLHSLIQDREYRNSGHLIHGAVVDVRDGNGNQTWCRRFMSIHMPRIIDWNGDGFMEIAAGMDLQRGPLYPNAGIFDGTGCLLAVVPRYGFGADIDNDGYEEFVSYVGSPGKPSTIEVFKMGETIHSPGRGPAIKNNRHCYNEFD